MRKDMGHKQVYTCLGHQVGGPYVLFGISWRPALGVALVQMFD
jgi:hypothetical protein